MARTVKPVSGARLQGELKAVADGVYQLKRAIALLCRAAMIELMITDDVDAGSAPPSGQRSSPRKPLLAQPSGSEPWERLYRDLCKFGPHVDVTLKRVKAQTRRGPRRNSGADELFAYAIRAWKGATGSWPSGGKSEEGEATSPLPRLLQELVWPITDDPRKEALTDSRYFDVLRDVKGVPRAVRKRTAPRRRRKTER